MRSINIGVNKWRVSRESKPEAGIIVLRMVAKQIIGTPRRALIQLSESPGNGLEVRAKMAVGSSGSNSETRRLALQSQLAAEFKSNLEREMGVSLSDAAR